MKKKSLFISIIALVFVITIISVTLVITKSKSNDDLMLSATKTPKATTESVTTESPEFTEAPEVTEAPEYTEEPISTAAPLRLFYPDGITRTQNNFNDNDVTVNREISFSYPSFTMNGQPLTEINDQIKKFMLDFIDYSDDKTDLSFVLECDVGMANKNIISVFIKGSFMRPSMPHPVDIYRSLNFDLQNSKKFCLGSQYNIDNSFVDIFVNSSKEQLRAHGIREGYEEPLFEDIYEDVYEHFKKIDDVESSKFSSSYINPESCTYKYLQDPQN